MNLTRSLLPATAALVALALAGCSGSTPPAATPLPTVSVAPAPTASSPPGTPPPTSRPAAPAAKPARPAQPAKPARAVPIVLADCEGAEQIRPATFRVTCATGNVELRDLKWSSWGTTATATGTRAFNECEPNCVSGPFRYDPVALTLSDAAAWPGHPGKKRFRTMTVRYLKAPPPGEDAAYAMPLTESGAL